jgi:hypothetical protein
MDDITVVAQDDLGSQVLMDAVQEFEFWSNTKLNMAKTVGVIGSNEYQWRKRGKGIATSNVQTKANQSLSSHGEL